MLTILQIEHWVIESDSTLKTLDLGHWRSNQDLVVDLLDQVLKYEKVN